MSLTDMIAAFTVATLAGTGVGGGGLFVIYLTLIGKVPQTTAQAINLIFFISASSAALVYHLKHRRLNLRLIAISIVFGVIGTLLGGILRQRLDESAVRSAFGVMLILTGGYSLFKGSVKRLKNMRKISGNRHFDP